KDEIATVEKGWASHNHETVGGQAQSWKSVGQALEHAKADCAAGKEREAFETINLVHRWLGSKEHTKH
ncbi:MAG: hypothetical protein IT565_13955, partial [Rhodospirillales bacterium]|nr:hypothetical protein [Rhodospirillales bacterium]